MKIEKLAVWTANRTGRWYLEYLLAEHDLVWWRSGGIVPVERRKW